MFIIDSRPGVDHALMLTLAFGSPELVVKDIVTL